MTMSPNEECRSVALALSEAVRMGGTRLADEPQRVRGMMSDLLGVDARTHRAEVDAIVIAGEVGVPRQLATEVVPTEHLVDEVLRRGLDDQMATYAVASWAFALGRSETAPIDQTSLPMADGSARTPEHPTSGSQQPPAGEPSARHLMIGTPDDPAATPDAPVRTGRHQLLLAGVVVALISVGAIAALLNHRGGEPAMSAVAASDDSRPPDVDAERKVDAATNETSAPPTSAPAVAATPETAAPAAPATPGTAGVFLDMSNDAYCSYERLHAVIGEAWGEGVATESNWGATQTSVLPALRAQADIATRNAGELAAFGWDATVQPDMDLMIGDFTAVAAWFLQMSLSGSPEELNALYAAPPTESSDVEVIRAKLGLPASSQADVQDCGI